MSRWADSDRSRFDERDESAATDARFDNHTYCAECGDEIEPGLRDLCSVCRIYIEGEHDED